MNQFHAKDVALYDLPVNPLLKKTNERINREMEPYNRKNQVVSIERVSKKGQRYQKRDQTSGILVAS